ncbi:MAG: hypothetical protein E6J03_04330 [Chloroflexi bacterium]|nr:MAG: hypothetical protein E6J03_04330 [Chloroflexota bacterium]
MSVPAAVRARWRVHLPTALETRVRAIGVADPRDPWPSARALDALLAAGAVREGPPRAVGAGAGPPLIASQRLCWAGVELEVECVAMAEGVMESNLVAPSWDELTRSAAGEDAWWELADAFLAAVDARHGALVDGEAVEVEEPTPSTLRARLRRHLGLLVPESVAGGAGAAADAYRWLPRSGLVVLLR